MPDHHGQTYDPQEEPPSRSVIGWANAGRMVRGFAVAVFLAASAFVATALYKPANPQPAVLTVAALGCGGIAAWFALIAGNIIAHPRTREEARFWLGSESYNRQSVPAMLQLGILLAVGALFFLHVNAYWHTGSWLSATTAAVLLAIIAYPFVRYRIERGRWPD